MSPMDYFTLFASFTVAIVLEAAPFLLLGAFVSACIEQYVKPERLQRLMPKSMPLQLLAGAGAGLLLPTCECGVVPVTRRLMAKGAPPALAITYMLSAPVVNPVVLASTYMAFRGDVETVLLRVALVLAPAVVLGSLAGQIPAKLLLRPDKEHEHAACGCAHHHDHDYDHEHLEHEAHHHHDHGHEQHEHVAHHKRGVGAVAAVLRHTGSEFASMGAFLILGAMAAAAFKTFVPQQVLTLLAQNPYLAVGGMAGLAIVLSVCSEADAFVAASFTGMPQSAQLAFMSVGPMVDLKLLAMFFAVFHRRFASTLAIVPVVMVCVACIAMAYANGAGGP